MAGKAASKFGEGDNGEEQAAVLDERDEAGTANGLRAAQEEAPGTNDQARANDGVPGFEEPPLDGILGTAVFGARLGDCGTGTEVDDATRGDEGLGEGHVAGEGASSEVVGAVDDDVGVKPPGGSVVYGCGVELAQESGTQKPGGAGDQDRHARPSLRRVAVRSARAISV